MSANYDPGESVNGPGPNSPRAQTVGGSEQPSTGPEAPWRQPGSVATERAPAASATATPTPRDADALGAAPRPAPPTPAPRMVPTRALVEGRIREFIWLSVAVVDAFLALNFAFRALAVARGGFVGVVTRVGDSLASPFTGIFQGTSPPPVGHTVDWQSLVAVVVYTVAAWVAARMCILLLRPVRPAARF